MYAARETERIAPTKSAIMGYKNGVKKIIGWYAGIEIVTAMDMRQTTVLKEIVDALGFKNGDKIRWLLFHNGKIIITKVNKKKSAT